MKPTMHSFFLAVFLLFGVQPVSAAADEYSATTKESSSREGERTGKLFVGKDGMRTEYEMSGEKLVQIVNYHTQEVYLLNPGKRSFMRHAIQQSGGAAAQPQPSANPCEGQPGITCKSLGIEDVLGRPAVKWQLNKSGGGQDSAMILWLDRQRHTPLKQTMPNGVTMTRRLLGKETVNGRQTEKWEMAVTGGSSPSSNTYQWYDPELKTNVREQQADVYSRELLDIKVGSQPAALFAVPGDFKEVKPGQGGSQQR